MVWGCGKGGGVRVVLQGGEQVDEVMWRRGKGGCVFIHRVASRWGREGERGGERAWGMMWGRVKGGCVSFH